eukprot:jgi/Ulvmu1/4249/UM192_0009.1
MATASRPGRSCRMGCPVAALSWQPRVCKQYQRSLTRICPRHVDAVQRREGRLLHQPRAESSVPLHAAAGHSDVPKKSTSISQLTKRILAGCVMGAVGAAVVIQGGLAYFAFIELFVYQATREYFGFVTAIDQKEGRPLPPPWAASLVTLSCMFLPLYCFLTGGKIAVALALSAFVMLSIFVTNTQNPRMATVSSAIFGLLYCGYLPTYWLKLRLLAMPVLASPLAHNWPVILGGLSQITVGLIATFFAAACIVASDVGAYFVGKNFGRTKLSAISPGKTVEGAVGGLLSSVAVAVGLSALVRWPATPLTAAAFGGVVCCASVLGDLIESVLKRDAGLKDSGTLIPGHGGILDRFDSYVFTGAVVYFYLKCLPLLGG